MQPNGAPDESFSKVTRKRPKSGTRYPKKLPTYVVGFALKETYDGLTTAQQMICNKRSSQESTNSVTPTNSLKMIESEQVVKLGPYSNAGEGQIEEENEVIKNRQMNDSEFNDSETKIEDTKQKEFINCNRSDMSLDKSIEEYPNNGEEINQPEIIFNAINYGQRNKETKLIQRKSKGHKIVKSKCNKFKCKVPKITISNRLEKYYEKAKRNSINCGQIQQGFSNISTVVSRTRVLKKVLAKENLFEETDLISILNLTEHDDESLSSHPSTAKNESFISDSSGNTLTRKSSTTSSKNEDVYSFGTVKSTVEISPQNIIPYKTDVINVAVAVTYKKSKVIITDALIPNKEKLLQLENTNAETPTMDSIDLIPEIPSDFLKTKTNEEVISNQDSDATLVNNKQSFDVCSDDDSFDMARTSSDFNESSNYLTFSINNDLETVIDVKNNVIEDIEQSNIRKENLLQTVINLGCYTEVTPSTSSAGTFTSMNNVIVTKNANQSYPVTVKNKGDNCSQSNINSSVLKKQFNERNVSSAYKNINLPKEAQIKAMLEDYVIQPRKCAEEARHYPTNIPEMWDMLVLLLDVALKRLEDSLAERIVSELKKYMASIESRVPPPSGLTKDLEKGNIAVKDSPAIQLKEFSAHGIKQEADECLQCDLVQNKVIDQIMLKLSNQGPKIIDPGRSVKSLQKLKSMLPRDAFEGIKPPAVVSPEVLTEKVDTMTISTVTEGFYRFHRLRMLFFAPLNFVRENVLVISSVPAFFVVLLVVYGLLMMILKPW